MNFTIKDVLSHPTIKRLVFTKNKIEIERMRNILLVLLLYDKLQSIYKKYKLSELAMKNGQQNDFIHFKECSRDEGSDACICCYVQNDCVKILNILDKLNLDDESEQKCNNLLLL